MGSKSRGTPHQRLTIAVLIAMLAVLILPLPITGAADTVIQARAFGDSFTAGAYPQLLADAWGWTLSNYAVGGTQLDDFIYHSFDPTIVTDEYYLSLLAQNDMMRIGIDETQLNSWQESAYAFMAHLGIPDSHKVRATSASVQYSGTWSESDHYFGDWCRYSTQDGAAATFAIGGPVIYVAYVCTLDASGCSISVAVDGEDKGTFGCYGGVSKYGSYTLKLVRLTGLTDTDHEVVLTVNAGATGRAEWAWAGTVPPIESCPHVLIGCCLRQVVYPVYGSDAAVAAMNQRTSAACADLKNDGLRLHYVDITPYYVLPNDVASDGVHPNAQGHQHICDAFSDVVKTLQTVSVSSVTPDHGCQGQALSVSLVGTNLTAVNEISFGPGIAVSNFNCDNSTHMTVNIAIADSAIPGARDVSVANMVDTFALEDGFSVNEAPPVLVGVNPMEGMQGQTLNVTITGDHLLGVTILDFGTEITTNSYTMDSATQITASITVGYGAPEGPTTVLVTSSVGTATLSHGFCVTRLNHQPDQPTNTLPADGVEGASLTPTLQSSAFSDPDADYHAASEWQIRLGSGSYAKPVYDSVCSTLYFTELVLSATPLRFGCSTTYYWRVRYQDTYGAWSDWSDETSFTTEAWLDDSPPSTPAVIDDGEMTASTTELHASWSASDPETGVNEFVYAIGTSPAGTELVQWTSAGNQMEVTEDGLSLIPGTTYYFFVKAKNGQSLWSEIGVSDGIVVASTSESNPPTPVVSDDGQTTTQTGQLRASWTCAGADSSIVEYLYAIGTSAGGTDLVDWTSAGTDTEVTHTGLSLTVGNTYYFSVRGKDSAGSWSDVGISDGILVEAANGDENGDGGDGEVGGCCSSSNVQASAADVAMVWGALGLCCGTGLVVARRMGKRSRKQGLRTPTD